MASYFVVFQNCVYSFCSDNLSVVFLCLDMHNLHHLPEETQHADNELAANTKDNAHKKSSTSWASGYSCVYFLVHLQESTELRKLSAKRITMALLSSWFYSFFFSITNVADNSLCQHLLVPAVCRRQHSTVATQSGMMMRNTLNMNMQVGHCEL